MYQCIFLNGLSNEIFCRQSFKFCHEKYEKTCAHILNVKIIGLMVMEQASEVDGLK